MNQPPHHPDDEALSAFLDGSDADGVAAHLSACASCAERFDALGRARAALAAEPEPLPDLTRRRLVATAIESAGTPLASRDAILPGRARARRSRRLLPMLGAAAAAVFVVGGIVALQDDGGNGADTTALGGSSFSEGTAGGGLAAGGGAGVPLLELGDLDDPDALREALRNSGVVEFDATAGPDAATGGSASAGGGGSAADDASNESDGESTPEEVAPVAGFPHRAMTAEPTDSDEGNTYDDFVRCLAEAQPPGTALVLAGRGSFGDTPALALAFRSAETERILVLVVARDDCGVLHSESFTESALRP
ncbi:MAG TPA: hypothetical protein VM618_02975 [Acidimicrobiia bacterium]|nr:hypothetical protein [Acidimicrobiia bacterium]